MTNLKQLYKHFSACRCGRKHECAIKDIRIGKKMVGKVGKILKENDFPEKLLLVADENTIKAAAEILKSLRGFKVKTRLYENFRIPSMEEVERIEDLLEDAGAALVVGTGSLSDVCRLAAHRKNSPLCIFATAPSMDGFASSVSPIIVSGFKRSFSAKPPEVIITDTEILAAAPNELKAAGFGDMIGKYIALIDWEVSHILTGEYFCRKIAGLMRRAADAIFRLSSHVQKGRDVSKRLFEVLLLAGIAMSFAKDSRPASGAEHMLAHFWECLEIASGKIPKFHGIYVGVATLLVGEYYRELAEMNPEAWSEIFPDMERIFALSGSLGPKMREINKEFQTVSLDKVKKNWQQIRNIILSYPAFEEILRALKEAGAPTGLAEVGIGEDLWNSSWKCHPFIRNRFTLMRLMSHYHTN